MDGVDTIDVVLGRIEGLKMLQNGFQALQPDSDMLVLVVDTSASFQGFANLRYQIYPSQRDSSSWIADALIAEMKSPTEKTNAGVMLDRHADVF